MLRFFYRLFFWRKNPQVDVPGHVDVANIQKEIQFYIDQNWHIDGGYTANEIDLILGKSKESKPKKRKRRWADMSSSTFSASLAPRRVYPERVKLKRAFEDPDLLKGSVERSLAGEKDRKRRAELKRCLAYLEEKYPSFSVILFRMIKRKGISQTKCYRRSNLDRRLFSKIRSDKDYHPQKNTIFALIIGLNLDIEEAQELLQAAGYSLSRNIKMDVIMEYLINEKIYDILAVNEILYSFDCPLLGSK